MINFDIKEYENQLKNILFEETGYGELGDIIHNVLIDLVTKAYNAGYMKRSDEIINMNKSKKQILKNKFKKILDDLL